MTVSGREAGSRAKSKKEERDSDLLHLAWVLEPDTKRKGLERWLGRETLHAPARRPEFKPSGGSRQKVRADATKMTSDLNYGLWRVHPPPHSNGRNAKRKLIYTCATI